MNQSQELILKPEKEVRVKVTRVTEYGERYKLFVIPKNSFEENYDWGLKIPLILSSILILIYFIYPSILTNVVSSIIIY